MKEKIDQFLIALNTKFPQDGPCSHCYVLKRGTKYTRIMTAKSPDAEGGSAYAFIDNVTGDLFMAASFRAPAKHARGNINNASGLKACGECGVARLK